MTPLQQSYRKEYEKILQRGSVWVRDPYTWKWYHSYDKGLVRETLGRLLSLFS